MDVLGEVMVALDAGRRAGLSADEDAWRLESVLVDDLAKNWQQPDNGIWEIRGPRRHFTHSRVMVWAAFDRGVRAAEDFGLEAPLERWREVRDAVRAEILDRGYDFLLRYRTETGVVGVPGDEHPFLACSFWLVSAYAAAGRRDDAHALFDRLVGLVNDVGLLAEEYDPVRQRMAGNFPQAFSHLTLVQAALRLARLD